MLMFLRFALEKRRYYIWNEDVRVPANGEAYFGPFGSKEIQDRVNDWVADMLADSGNLEVLRLTKSQVKKIGFVNPRAWWMRELANMENWSKS